MSIERCWKKTSRFRSKTSRCLRVYCFMIVFFQSFLPTLGRTTESSPFNLTPNKSPFGWMKERIFVWQQWLNLGGSSLPSFQVWRDNFMPSSVFWPAEKSDAPFVVSFFEKGRWLRTVMLGTGSASLMPIYIYIYICVHKYLSIYIICMHTV